MYPPPVGSRDRVTLIVECAELLATRDGAKVDMVLNEVLGLTPDPNDSISSITSIQLTDRVYRVNETIMAYVMRILDKTPDSGLRDLHTFLFGSGREAPSPAVWYKHVEDWFGEPFDEKLAHRIANMPEEQKVPYIHSFPLVDWSLP
jgi:hypothetical protein